MAKFDPAVVQKMADRLYANALGIVLIWSIVGTVGGAIAGAFAHPLVAELIGRSDEGTLLPMVVLSLAICGFLGFAYGREKAFSLKLEAQRLLCQLQIEANTRQCGT